MEDVLIVIDMQNDFITGSLGSKDTQKIVPKVVEKIKEYHEAGKDVYYTRDTHFGDYLDTLEGQKLPVKHCFKNTDGWKICDEIRNIIAKNMKMQSRVIDKYTFGYMDWDNRIGYIDRNLNLCCDYDSIEIVGLCTDICVVSNALILRALFPNTKIVVDAQCCAGTTPEKHKAALDVMESCQIDVIGG